MMRRTCRVGLAALLTLIAAAPAFAEDKVEVKMMKYDDLKKLITDNKGKVIVVDFWQDFCIVCKKEMPRLIELKKKYGDDLVAITVNPRRRHDPNPEKAKDENTHSRSGATTPTSSSTTRQAVWSKKPERQFLPDGLRVPAGREVREALPGGQRKVRLRRHRQGRGRPAEEVEALPPAQRQAEPAPQELP